MADEARVTIQISITREDQVDYNRSVTFSSDVANARGPSPGLLIVPTDGRDVYFTELTTPGLALIQNLDDENYVEMGVYVPSLQTFFPLLEFLPGEAYPVRFSRNLGEEYSGSGTGTSQPENYVRFKANAAQLDVRVEAFDAEPAAE